MTSEARATTHKTPDAPSGQQGPLSRIARGDAVAFRSVVDEQAGRLRGIAYHMLGDPTEAEDVAQETLVRLWRDAPVLVGKVNNLGGWCTRVAVNQCLDRLRRRRFVSGEAMPDRADEAANQPSSIDARRMEASVIAAMGRLPDRQRAAIVLTYYEELPNHQGAAALDLNLKAFESLLFRARRALRSDFEGLGLSVESFGWEGEEHG